MWATSRRRYCQLSLPTTVKFMTLSVYLRPAKLTTTTYDGEIFKVRIWGQGSTAKYNYLHVVGLVEKTRLGSSRCLKISLEHRLVTNRQIQGHSVLRVKMAVFWAWFTTYFWPFWYHCKMAVTWLYATLRIRIIRNLYYIYSLLPI